MKEIIIKPENAEKIMAEFKAVQGRSTARTVDSYKYLVMICDRIDDRLKRITKKAKNGTVVYYNFATKFPSSYKYTPQSTHFTLTFKNGFWRVSNIYRDTCPNQSKLYPYTMKITEKAKEEILKDYE